MPKILPITNIWLKKEETNRKHVTKEREKTNVEKWATTKCKGGHGVKVATWHEQWDIMTIFKFDWKIYFNRSPWDMVHGCYGESL
jgi:hypothetical protein